MTRTEAPSLNSRLWAKRLVNTIGQPLGDDEIRFHQIELQRIRHQECAVASRST